MGKFKFMMMLQSSDGAYRSFVRFIKKFFRGERLSPKEMGNLFLALREDAFGKTDLTSKEILSTFIKDIDSVQF